MDSDPLFQRKLVQSRATNGTMTEKNLIDREEAARITRYLDLKAPARRADIAFAFGSARSAPTHVAAKLFLEGIVDYIVLTGGRNRQSGEIEADKHLPILRQKGIPPERIILENRSTNTMENVCFARALIEKRLNMDHVNAIVAVSKWYHSRRAVMTLKRFLPQGISYFTSTYQLRFIRRNDWWQNETGRRYVMKEWYNIPLYLKKGHLSDVQQKNGAYV